MTDIVLTGLTLAVLFAAYPAMILHDVLRHPAPAPQAPPADRGGMTTGGVPYVAGFEPTTQGAQ